MNSYLFLKRSIQFLFEILFINISHNFNKNPDNLYSNEFSIYIKK